jgi:sugar phosphate isomerase/epimerase
MIIGASSFASPLDELRKEVECIEFYVPKLGLYNGNKLLKNRVDGLRDKLSTGNTLTTLHAPYFGITPGYPTNLMVDTSRMGKREFHLMEESIDLAVELGCSVVVLHPGKITGDRVACFTSMVTNLRRLALFAENRGIVLGLENLSGTDPANLCCTAEEHVRAIREVNSANLKATLDIGHANLTCRGNSERLRRFIRELGDSVAHVHVHDNDGMPADRYFGDVHGAPGKGNIDFSLLKELRFNGVYNLEVFTMPDVRMGKRMLMNLEQCTLDKYSA